MNESEELSLKVIQLLEAPKGLFAVIKKETEQYEAYPIILFVVFDDGSYDKIILADGYFEELDNIVNCVGCYTEKQIKEKFPEARLQY